MSDIACAPCGSEKSKPTARVTISKDEAAKMKVGSSVSLHMTGEVKSLHPSYDDKTMYEVEIEDPKVEVNSEEKDKEDTNPATMPREKLKKQIQKPAADEE